MAEQGWFPDPTGRHELRWWNGTAWSDHVSNRGHTAHDPLVPVPPSVPVAPVVPVVPVVPAVPVAPVAPVVPVAPAIPVSPPAWQPDPTGRNELRYWDGMTWTENVSNRGLVGVDPLAAPTPEPDPVQGTSAPSYFDDAGSPGTGRAPREAPLAPAADQPAPTSPPAVVDTSFRDGLAGGTSGLLFLSATEILPKASALTGLLLPCSEDRVSRRQIAGTLIASALLDLRDAGVVTLELGQRAGMFGRTDVRVTVRRVGSPAGAPGWGASLLSVDGDEHDVRELVATWIGGMMPDPYSHVLGFVEAELVARDVMTYADGTGLGSTFDTSSSGRKPTEVDCAAVAALQAERDEAVRRWQAAMAESDLLDKLAEECNLAVQGQELHA